MRLISGILIPFLLLLVSPLAASEPGLPFKEDFAGDELRDGTRTEANRSTEERALMLGWREKHFGAFGAGVAGVGVGRDTDYTRSVALGDVDGDGDLDLLAGNSGQQNRLFPS